MGRRALVRLAAHRGRLRSLLPSLSGSELSRDVAGVSAQPREFTKRQHTISSAVVHQPPQLRSWPKILSLCRYSQLQSARHFSASGQNAKDQKGLLQILLAQTGEGIAECEVIQYFVEEGQEVEEFQPVCEVQSDKASVEVTSRYKGTVNRIYFQKGDIAKVGEVLLDLTPVGGLPPESDVQAEPAPGSVGGSSEKPLATPAVRALAKEEGVDLKDVVGTGKDGRILAEDIQRHLSVSSGVEETREAAEPEPQRTIKFEQPAISLTPQESYKEEDTVVPIRGYRRAMVKSMTAANDVPHFMFGEEIEMDALMLLRNQLRDDHDVRHLKLTYLPFLLKALSQTLRKFPEMNSALSADHTSLTHKAAHNIGVAMATPSGLVVPNVKHCEKKSVLQIAEELGRLSRMAKENGLQDADLKGGTITLSNVGTIGGSYATPLVNVPEVAIVALGRIQRLPRYDGSGTLRPASLMHVSWSADHRVIDGATLASFCKEWKNLIENPGKLLLHLR